MRCRVLVLTALALGGCRDRPATEAAREAELPTVDVAPAPDAALSIAEDAIAKPYEAAGGLSGALPDGFPADVPIALPASLVESESDASGLFVLVLDSPRPPGEVEADQSRRLVAAGWQQSTSRFRKDGRTVRIEIEAIGSGSRLRLSYAPAAG